MTTLLYSSGSETWRFPDVTIIPTSNRKTGRFLVVESERKIFHEAANSLETSIELKEVLQAIKDRALADKAYTPDVADVMKFGILPTAKEAVQNILEKYANIAREKDKNFTPGVQYDFHRLTEEGIEVTLGNYGIFFATLIEGARNPDFKKYLADQGKAIYGTPQAFFCNPPATNTAVLSLDGYLFMNRGPTAEYAHMIHQIAAGHHFPDKTMNKGTNIVELEELAGLQIETETGKSPSDLKELELLGIAFSTGYSIEGTEKAEVLTRAKLPFNAEDIWQSIQQNATYQWKTRGIYVVPENALSEFMKLTLEKNTHVSLPPGVRTFGSTKTIGTDSLASGLWVPVGAASMLLAGGEMVMSALPQNYQQLNS